MPIDTKSPAIDAKTKNNVDLWLNGHYDEKTKAEIRQLLKDNPKEIIDAFYTQLSFGTAGMRGLMGVGSNRMNQYTVRAATQALANYLNTQPPQVGGHSVFIGYDSRKNSQFFAEEAAKVLAANGIRVYLCRELRPTPFVSFGCRYKHCTSAIMVTASHNPAAYNGYKVYWNDGGQVLPPHDKSIIAEFNAITDTSKVKKIDSLVNPLIVMIEDDVDEAYLETIALLQNYSSDNQKYGNRLSVVYTSLHGTGITLMPQALALWGFTNLSLVEPQVIPDGSFPTVAFPNPEEPDAMKMGMELLKKIQGDILIASDPDADRLGVAVRDGSEIQLLNGNQIACILLHHVCEALSDQDRLPANAAFIKTIVTTELFQVIVDAYHRTCVNVLPGFKYIAEKIRNWEKDPNGKQFIFGGEESYGYLFGTQTRDKDAIVAGVLMCEVALHAKRQGKTVLDILSDIYKKYGVFVEELLSVSFEESRAGKEQMANATARLRDKPLQSLAGSEVVYMEDCQTGFKTDLKKGKKEKIDLPQSDVIIYWLADGSKVIIRPSGTEPKIKLYCGVVNREKIDQDAVIKKSKKRAHEILLEVKNRLLNV